MTHIKETIVVEGKDDRSAVLKAVDANIICTCGYGLNDSIISLIKTAYKETGIIIFTDPDHAGRRIREKLTDLFPEAKQAYLTESQAYKSGDIGIENAVPEDIASALESACAAHIDGSFGISINDLKDMGLAGSPNSAVKREEAGALLGIGYANTRTFLKRLNYMGISLQKLRDVCERTDDKCSD